MSSPAKQVRDHLISIDGFWPIFVGSEPTSPDNCVTIYDTGGVYANQDSLLSDPSVQIRVRSFDYIAGYDQCSAVRDQLIVNKGFIVGDWYYTGFWITMDVAKIGRDDADRELFTCNLRAMRQPVDVLLATISGDLIQSSDGKLIQVMS